MVKSYKKHGQRIKSRMFKPYQVKSSYRKSKPKTLQIATRRNPSQILRFVINQTYRYVGASGVAGETAVLQYRANSIYSAQIPMSTNAAEWVSQDPTKYSNIVADGIQQNADGWDEWQNRYQHFCVLGSKCSSTFEPTTTGAAMVHVHHLSGVTPAITKSTQMKDINKLPYVYRNSIVATTVQRGNTGSRMSQQYSAKKFEGVKDVTDNSNLRGTFASGAPAGPNEQSYFTIALAPATQTPAGTANLLPNGILRVKIEYIVLLKEPTETNQVQVAGPSVAPNKDEL